MNLETHYETARIAGFIRSHSFKRVALQRFWFYKFPDKLLKDSMKVVKALRGELDSSVKLYVMAARLMEAVVLMKWGQLMLMLNASFTMDPHASALTATFLLHFYDGWDQKFRTLEVIGSEQHFSSAYDINTTCIFHFEKTSINLSNCSRKLLNHGLKGGKPVLVRFGLEYAHAIPEIKKVVASNASSICSSTSMIELLYSDVSCSVLSPSETYKPADKIGLIGSKVVNECPVEETSQNFNIGGLSWRLPQGKKMEDYLLFWIGSDDPAFENIVLTFNSCEIVRYDAAEDCLMTDLSQQKKILRRRYYFIEKAKDANMIGILVGTLGAAGYLHMVHQMREVITKAGKKSYAFFMGKPNPAKLANFPECDVFINVSCPQTALLDSKEFLAPIITPFEAMLAFDRGSQWTGAYVMEFRDLISSTPPVVREQFEEARFSFIQGGYVEYSDLQDTDVVEEDNIFGLVNVTEKALQVLDRSLTKSIAKSGAEYFASRSYL